jgi:hypothetical protein
MVLSLINLNHPAHYISVGSLSVSLGNLIMVLMVFVLFGLALALPFPGHKSDDSKSKKGGE